MARRLAGEPIQYVVGRWSFRTLELLVDRRVLIPRPETEIVVERALDELRRLRGSAGRRPLAVADLGTGSGAIALSVAAEAVQHGAGPVEVWATDVSPCALEVARANRALLDASTSARVHLLRGPWWEALPSRLRGRLDLVVSNPPYVAEADPVEEEVRAWEPGLALFSGPGGLLATEEILSKAPDWLARPGTVVLEVASARASESLELARRSGFGSELASDLAGRPRLVVGRVDAPRPGARQPTPR